MRRTKLRLESKTKALLARYTAIQAIDESEDMKTATCLRRSGVVCIFLSSVAILLTGPSSMASKYPPDPVEPSVAVTRESLLALRAPARVEKVAYQLVDTDKGPMPLNVDGESDLGSATRAIQEAFPTLPICREWPPNGEGPRFPFAVEANERLVDALDKWRDNSNGFVDWVLLRGRVVVTTQSLPSSIMDRPIHVDVTATTLQEALDQIAVAYNDRYSDFPLVVWPHSPRLMLRGRPEAASGESQEIALRTEGSLREGILAVMDQMEDTGVCFGLSDIIDPQGRRYFALHPTKDDAPELDSFADADEAALHNDMLQRNTQRLEECFAINAEKAARAAGREARP